MGDVNIDVKDSKAIGFFKLNDFMDLYNLKNLVKDNTCFHKGHEHGLLHSGLPNVQLWAETVGRNLRLFCMKTSKNIKFWDKTFDIERSAHPIFLKFRHDVR